MMAQLGKYVVMIIIVAIIITNPQASLDFLVTVIEGATSLLSGCASSVEAPSPVAPAG